MGKVRVDGKSLSLGDVAAVARKDVKIEVTNEAKAHVVKASRLIDRWVSEGKVIYGVTTGFGPMYNKIIPSKMAKLLQENLVRSHSAGVGDYLPKDVVRASMLVRANSLACGHSGVRLETLATLVKMVNEGVHPLIPELGSVGASGDLAPLSHMVLVMIGEGKAEYRGRLMDGGEAMDEARITRVKLSYKEGLALINGTSVMTGMAALAVHDAESLLKAADIATALTLEALKGIVEAFDERIQLARPHPGQLKSARNVQRLVEGSRLVLKRSDVLDKLKGGKKRLEDPKGFLEAETRIQDAYSLRCSPQVLGAVRDAVEYARKVVEIEVNSASDNPLVFPEEEDYLHGGNFHGQPVAMAMDTLGVALAEVGNLSERRIARLLDRNLSEGLPSFLIRGEEGLQSGFMGVQYIPTSLVAENRVLASPVSIQSISTNANNQDIVSMGTTAARKAMKILRNVEYILAVELLCASQAVEFRGSQGLGRGTSAAYRIVRREVPALTADRVLHSDVEKVVNLLESGALVGAVEKVVGRLD